MIYVAVDIGCLECGEASALIGLFVDRVEAEAALSRAEDKQRIDWHGQHAFKIFEGELPEAPHAD